MYQIDIPTAASSQPASTSEGTPGYFTDGNPTTGAAATILPAEFVNAIMLELLNAITASGQTPVKNQFTQLANAIPPGMVGQAIRVSAELAAAGTSVTFTADSIAVGTALGTPARTLANFNETLNVATQGAGGMDTGSAPDSGYVAIYAICDPTSGAVALLGTAASQTTVYGGSNLPSGYTLSALLAVWPTNGSGQLIAGTQCNRKFLYFVPSSVISGGTATSATELSLAAAVPACAREILGKFSGQETGSISSLSAANFGPTSGSAGLIEVSAGVAEILYLDYLWVPLVAPQTFYYQSGKTTVLCSLAVCGFEI